MQQMNHVPVTATSCASNMPSRAGCVLWLLRCDRTHSHGEHTPESDPDRVAMRAHPVTGLKCPGREGPRRR
eukprot:1440499-Alexandrium_andersonii.AAC.1